MIIRTGKTIPARIIGAAGLSEQARLLEAAGDNKDISTIDRDTPSLLTLFRSYKGALAPLDDTAEDLPDAPADIIEDAYNGLNEFAVAMDYELANMVLDSMKEYRLPDEDRDRFGRIRSRLSQLDWEGIREILKEKD